MKQQTISHGTRLRSDGFRMPARQVNPHTVYLRENTSKSWVVSDEKNLRGGTFKDLKSAFHFINRGFVQDLFVVVLGDKAGGDKTGGNETRKDKNGGLSGSQTSQPMRPGKNT